MILARYMPNSSSSPATVEEASAIVGELTITFGFWASGFTQSIASNMLTTWMLNNFSVDGGSSPSVDTTTRAGASITTEPKGTDGNNGISHRVRVVPAFKKDTLIALDKESVTGISARIVSMAEYKVMEQERRAIIKRYTGLDIPEDDEPVGTPILGTPVSSSDVILGSQQASSFDSSVTSWCPTLETQQAKVTDGTYIQAYNAKGTEYMTDSSEAAEKFIEGCDDAPECNSVLKYSGLSGATTTAFKPFLLDDHQEVYGSNGVKVVANENIKSFYLPIANGDASTEFSSTQTGTTGAKFNQTMVMAVAFNEADPSLKVTSTIFDYQNATGTALEATDVSTSDTVQAGHGMRSVISSSTECWSPMPR